MEAEEEEGWWEGGRGEECILLLRLRVLLAPLDLV